MSLRILLLTADFPPDIWSGIGTAVYNQALALARAGHDVHVLAALPGRRPAAAPRQPGLTVHDLSTRRCPVDPRAFDVVHLHSLPLAELALEMQRRFRLPLVYTAHSLLPSELAGFADTHSRFWSAAQRALMQRSDRVILLNRSDRRQAAAALPGLERRSTVIPNGFASPVSEYREEKDTAGRDPLCFVRSLPPEPIVFAGRFARTKGLALLAEIVSQVLKRAVHHFVLAGGHGDAAGERAVKGVVDRYPDNCRVLPWLSRPALDELLGRAALVLAPSTYEPFGLVALEALRTGTPVLAAAVGGLAETIRPGSGGQLVASHDPEIWAAEILTLMAAPQRRAALGRQGPGYVAANFGAEKWTRRLETAYSGSV